MSDFHPWVQPLVSDHYVPPDLAEAAARARFGANVIGQDLANSMAYEATRNGVFDPNLQQHEFYRNLEMQGYHAAQRQQEIQSMMARRSAAPPRGRATPPADSAPIVKAAQPSPAELKAKERAEVEALVNAEREKHTLEQETLMIDAMTSHHECLVSLNTETLDAAEERALRQRMASLKLHEDMHRTLKGVWEREMDDLLAKI